MSNVRHLRLGAAFAGLLIGWSVFAAPLCAQASALPAASATAERACAIVSPRFDPAPRRGRFWAEHVRAPGGGRFFDLIGSPCPRAGKDMDV